MSYIDAVNDIWRHHDLRDAAEDHAVLVQYAILAASSHNTQPWKFRLKKHSITILADFSRRCPAVDPDDHHLYVSLGCAAANLLEAAAAAGLQTQLDFDPASSALRVKLRPGEVSRSSLFNAIPLRRCSRSLYDGSPVNDDQLRQLQSVCQEDGTALRLLTDRDSMQRVTELVMAGNQVQMSDPAWRQELVDWIRFNENQALLSGDGLYAAAMGNPNVPQWLGRLLFPLLISPRSQNRKDAKAIQSSAGIGVFISEVDDAAHWIKTGINYQRFALQATAMGLCNAFINPPVEVPALRRELADWLGTGEQRPDLLVRFGCGPSMPHSLRRPLQQVLI